jgi:hypothetical protein
MIPGCVYPPPQITSLYADSSITPNGYVLVRGKNFNSANGSGGKLQFSIGSFVHDLVDLQWSDDSIRGRVPDGWNWKEQVPVDLWVVRADGTRSAPLTPRPVFTPVYEIKMLRGIDISSFHCAPSDSYTCYVTDIGYGTVSAIHSTAWGLDSGTDSYQARLANGWVTDSIKFEVSPAMDASAGPPSGFQAGLDHVDIQVHWQNYGGDYFTGSGTSDSYRIEVFIRGPKGFPWNPAKP